MHVTLAVKRFAAGPLRLQRGALGPGGSTGDTDHVRLRGSSIGRCLTRGYPWFEGGVKVMAAGIPKLRLAWCVVLGISVIEAHVDAAPFVPERNAQCIAVSADGLLVATAKSGMSNSEFPPRPHPTVRKCGLIQIWDARTGQMLQRLQSFGDFTNLRFSPDGKRLASCRLFTPGGGLELSEVRLWDVATGKSLRQFNRCHAFSFSPDGGEIAVLSRTKCVIYEAESYSKLRRCDPLGKAVAVEYSFDGRHLLGIREQQGRFQVVMCDPQTGALQRASMDFAEPFYTLAMSPDKIAFATGHKGGVVLHWNLESLVPVAQFRTLEKNIQHPFFSPDGQTLAAGSQRTGDVEFWDLTTGRQVYRYTFARGTVRTYHPRDPEDRICPERDPPRFSFMPDGGTFIAGCYGGMIRVVANGQEVKRFGY